MLVIFRNLQILDISEISENSKFSMNLEISPKMELPYKAYACFQISFIGFFLDLQSKVKPSHFDFVLGIA